MTNFFLKYFPYDLFCRFYYNFFKIRKDKFLKKVTNESNFRDLKNVDLKKYKKSNKLFIIGSGHSLNEIKPEQWKEINDNDSLGFNFSFLNNDHIPNFFTIEAMSPLTPGQKYRNHVADIFTELYPQKKEQYKNVIKFVTDLSESKKIFFEDYSKDLLDENCYILNTVNGLARNKSQFLKLIKYYKKKGIFDQKTNLDVIFKFRATLSMVISFGINLGYDEIILCGIDLNDPRYFYQDKTKYPNLPSFTSSKPGKTHESILKERFMIGIDEVCFLIDSYILKEKRKKIFIQNPKSELKKYFSVYNFKN